MRSQGTRESLGFFWRSLETPTGSGEREPQRFLSDFEMTVEERDFSRMSENVKATIWAATQRLGQMRLLLMHEKHKEWKRKIGYGRLETAAEMDEKRSRTSTSPVSNLFFYSNMVIPSHPNTPDEFTLEMKVDVEGLRMEIILSEPALSQCDPSPRRAVVDTGSVEPGTPQQSPAISTGQWNPERRRSHPRSVRGHPDHRKQQRKWRKKFPLLNPVWTGL